MIDRILITGGSGFIGTNLLDLLTTGAAKEVEVVNFDLEPPRKSAHRTYWVPGDLRDTSSVLDAFEQFRPNRVFHLGARTDLHGKAVADYEANTKGVSNVILAANSMRHGCSVIYASSRLVCDVGYSPKDEFDYSPSHPYGESKVVGEKLVRQDARHPYVIVRPTSIWGPWFGVPYRDFFETVLSGRFVLVSGTFVEKSFGYVGNTVHSLHVVMTRLEEIAGETIYLGDYPPIEVGAFATQIRQELGKRPPRTIRPSLIRMLARTGDLLKFLGYREPPLTTFRLNNMLTPMVYDLDPLRSLTGELPYSEQHGIRETLRWLNGDTVPLVNVGR